MLAIGGGVFAIFGLRLFVLQSRLVFRPSRELLGTPQNCGYAFDSVVLKIAGGVCVRGWWIPGSGARKAILYFPGSIGNMSCELTTLVWLANTGAQVMTIDYPGFGQSDGRPNESGCYQAAEAAWRYAVEQRAIAPADILIFGRSLGVAIAARVAARNPCGGLVIHSGIASVPAVAARRYPVFPVYLFCYIRFNTLKYVPRCDCPILVMHSRTDRVIPISHGERILRAASSPKRFVLIPGDHYTNDWHAAPNLADEVASMLCLKVEARQ
jgi:uncharacterized protein